MSSFRANVFALLGVAIVGGAGFVLGRYTGSEAATLACFQRVERRSERLEQAFQRLEQHSGSVAAPVIAAAFDLPSLREDIRRILREELGGDASKGKVADLPALDSATSDRVAESNAEAIEAFNQGQRLVQSARSMRRWNTQQAHEMRGLLSRLSDDQRRTVMDELLSAISRGEVTSDGPPL